MRVGFSRYGCALGDLLEARPAVSYPKCPFGIDLADPRQGPSHTLSAAGGLPACALRCSTAQVMVKRILRTYGYPPDKQAKATETVMQQAEFLCADWAG